jgi:hypothetical protein
VEGDPGWKRLAELPEFVEPEVEPELSVCPNCGEKFEAGFDSCWKCGTKRDGSPPTLPKEVFDETRAMVNPAPLERCPKCDSSNVVAGKLLPSQPSSSAVFEPEGTKRASVFPGVVLASNPSFACLDCGLVWDFANPEELKEFIAQHCQEGVGPDASELLAEAGRLEAGGSVVAAFSKYEAIKEQFPGTEASREAEASIRNLREKLG